MSKRKFLVIIIVLLLITALFLFAKDLGNGKVMLADPRATKVTGVKTTSQTAAAPTTAPQTPSFNPPKEIHYNRATNLKWELESINPQVLDTDFE